MAAVEAVLVLVAVAVLVSLAAAAFLVAAEPSILLSRMYCILKANNNQKSTDNRNYGNDDNNSDDTNSHANNQLSRHGKRQKALEENEWGQS